MTLTELARCARRELERIHAAGQTPDASSVAGWEFRGSNPSRWARPLGIEKFVKGFFHEAEAVEGYNVWCSQSDWKRRTRRGRPWRHGWYVVRPAAGRFSGTLLLDYGASRRNAAPNPERLLRDYLVQPDPDNPDLLLGKAFVAGVPVSFFILERDCPSPS